MPATEELRVLIRTVADTSGARATQQALTQTQQRAAATNESLTGSVRNAALQYFTLTQAVSLASTAIGSIVETQRDHERITRANTASYGQQAAAFQTFAQNLSAATGFTSDAILEAALSARTLSQNYALTIQQTQKLITVSADLARIRGIGIAESFERIQSAIRGEAEASEYLGLTLNDTYIANNAMNGSLKTTFNTMTDQQKAQIRYTELLKQTAAFEGLAAESSNSLDGSLRRLETSTNKLQLALGRTFAPATSEIIATSAAGMDILAANTDLLLKAMGPLNTLMGAWQKFGEDLATVRTHAQELSRFVQEIGKGGALAPAIREAQQYGETIRQQTRELQRLKDLTTSLPPVAATGPQYLTEAQRKQFEKDQRDSRRLREINELPTQTAAADLARLAHWDQVDAAVREITSAQQQQVDLQQQSVNLAAQEASIRLSMLPTQERLAAAQRDAAEAQLRARRAALPASEALEDLRYEQERARLVASNRGMSAEERSAARRSLRSLARAEPGVALSALEAGRGVALAGRAVERVGLDQQLFQLTQERTLAQIRLAEETNTLLGHIADQRSQAIMLTVNVSGEAFSQEVYKELVEAADQAPMPPAVRLSGVRR